MNEQKKFSFVKPTLDTPFHIDFDWWKANDNNWQVFLQSFLCDEHKEVFNKITDDQKIDYIDPVTAEITQVDALQNTLITHCAQLPGFISENTPLVDAVFRAFLANGNQPHSPNQLSQKFPKSAITILQTVAALENRRGIRPYQPK
jgi:hypothetical protein